MTTLLQAGRDWLSRAAKNRVLRNSAYGGLSFAVPFLLSLVATPFLVAKMGLEGYGLWNIAMSALGLMSVFEFGLATAISKYVAEYHSGQNSEGLSAVTTTALLFNLTVGVALTVLLYLLAPQVARLFRSQEISTDQVAQIVRVAVLGFLPVLLRNSASAIATGFQRFGVPTLLNVGYNVLVLVSAILIILLGGSVRDVVLSAVALMWIVGLISWVWAIWALHPFGGRWVFSWSCAQQMLSFMMYAGLAGLGRQLFGSLDRIVVGAVLGLSQVTYYTVSVAVANKFISLSSALTQALMPATSSWHARRDMDKIRSYFWRSTLLFTGANLALAGFLLAVSDPFLNMWMGKEFADHALPAFRVLILVYAVSAMTAPAAQIANGIGIPWLNAIGALAGGGGTILLILIWGPLFGLKGVAWANAASWLKLGVPLFVAWYIRDKVSRMARMKNKDISTLHMDLPDTGSTYEQTRAS